MCGGKKSYASDAERVAFLFKRYQQLTSLLPLAAAKKTRTPRRGNGNGSPGVPSASDAA